MNNAPALVEEGEFVGGVFQIVKPLSSGTFGQVYVARVVCDGTNISINDKNTRLFDGLLVSVKIEPGDCKRPALKNESSLLKSIHQAYEKLACRHFCDFYHAGNCESKNSGSINFMAITLCDLSLSSLTMAQRTKTLEINFAHYLMSQVTKGIEIFHGVGFLHRDLKPANILISYQKHVYKESTKYLYGIEDAFIYDNSDHKSKLKTLFNHLMIFDCQTVLNEEETKKKKKIIRKINDLELRVAIPKIIDFGLARRYENPDGTLRKYRSLKVDFRGTKSFASISVLEGNDYKRSDDLLGLYYVHLWLIITPSFPWSSAVVKEMAGGDKKKENEIYCQLKRGMDVSKHLQHISSGLKETVEYFSAIFSYLSDLPYQGKPNYNILNQITVDRIIKSLKDAPNIDNDRR